MARFEPVFFDKLLGDGHGAQSSPAMRQWSLEELKRAVARDVESVLNTRTALTEADLAVWPECQRSVMTYGLNDFAGMSVASHSDRSIICASICAAIARHEPRLRDVRVTLEPDRRSTNALYFVIRALLVMHPAEEPVSFDAILRPSTSQYSVSYGR